MCMLTKLVLIGEEVHFKSNWDYFETHLAEIDFSFRVQKQVITVFYRISLCNIFSFN